MIRVVETLNIKASTDNENNTTIRLNPAREEEIEGVRMIMLSLKHITLMLVHIVVYATFFAVSGKGLGVIPAFLVIPLIVASMIDIDRFEIPDLASGFLVLSGLGIALWRSYDFIWFAAGSLVWGLGFLLAAFVARRILGRDALGLGDVKLMAGIGAWLGPALPIYVVLCASVAGILMIVITGLVNRSGVSGKAVAFGPFLCLSAWVVWLNGISI